jgi:hypothetical protein
MTLRSIVLSSVLLASLLVTVTAFAQTNTRQIKFLGTLGSSPGGFNTSEGRDINTFGQIAGVSTSPLGTRGFIWLQRPRYGLPAGMNALAPAFGLPWSEANSLNDLGEVAGLSRDSSTSKACLWLPVSNYGLPAGIVPLNSLIVTQALQMGLGQVTSSKALKITNSGTAYGIFETATMGSWSFRWSAATGVEVMLPSFKDANHYGDMLFSSVVCYQSSAPACQTINNFSPVAINNSGMILGFKYVAGHVHGYTRSASGQEQDIGYPGGNSEFMARDINDLGVAIGNSGAGAFNAAVPVYVYQPGSGIAPLSSLVPVPAGISIGQAVAINNTKEIVGFAVDQSGSFPSQAVLIKLK